MKPIPTYVELALMQGGWKPPTVPLLEPGPGATADERAEALIAQFRKLKIPRIGWGRTCAATDVQFFDRLHDDASCMGVRWEEQLGELAAFATAYDGQMVMFVDERGWIFGYGRPTDNMLLLGESFGEAMERVLVGIRYDKFIPDDEHFVRIH